MFQKYKWEKRLLISYFHDDEFQSFMKEEINRFFINNNKAIEERQLKYIAITRDDFDTNQISIIKAVDFMQRKKLKLEQKLLTTRGK